MSKKAEGCVHLVVKNGQVTRVFTHLKKLPENGVVHLKGDKIYTFNEFNNSHPNDQSELKNHKKKIIISEF